MFKCSRCGEVFEVPTVIHEFGYDRCPVCLNDDFYCVEKCERCGEYVDRDELHTSNKLEWLCEDCYEEEDA